MIAEGDALVVAKNHKVAFAKYVEAKQMGATGLEEKIRNCESAVKRSGQSFEEYLAQARMTSANAFGSNLNKWEKDNGGFSDTEKKMILQKLNEKIPTVNKRERKDWEKLINKYQN